MCTGIRLKARDGSIVYGRTMEFGLDTASEILVVPRQVAYRGTRADGKAEGLQWSSSYTVVGANMLGLPHFVDGMNDQGLAGGLFYFPGYASYQQVESSDGNHSLAPWELLTWILTTCASIEEVRVVLPTIKVAHVVFDQWNVVPPVHAIIHDAHGASLVIEYVAGRCMFYDNPLGVITNAPTFDWHMTNLKNYLNLSPHNADNKNLDGLIMAPFGQGSGMFGLPGDFTPPSRFVRAVAFSHAINQPDNAEQARDSAVHILNLFDIPRGVVRDADSSKSDYTQWTTIADLYNKQYYWHTYENRTMYVVQMARLDSAITEPYTIKMHMPYIIDRGY